MSIALFKHPISNENYIKVKDLILYISKGLNYCLKTNKSSDVIILLDFLLKQFEEIEKEKEYDIIDSCDFKKNNKNIFD